MIFKKYDTNDKESDLLYNYLYIVHLKSETIIVRIQQVNKLHVI